MLLYSVQSKIVPGVGVGFRSQGEPSSHEMVERTLHWNLEDLSWSWFLNICIHLEMEFRFADFTLWALSVPPLFLLFLCC